MANKSTENTQIDQPSLARFAILILPKLVQILVLGIITAPLWLFYLVGVLFWYRPPNVPHWPQIRRYLKYSWTVQPDDPPLPVYARVWITILITQKIFMMPINGLAWLLDELLYGKKLDAIEINEPLYIISAARSGSTQITRYLEEDPHLVAPNILQAMFPYLWLWRLAPKTIGRVFNKEQIRERIRAMMPPELWERHESDPFRADTFDGSFYTFHMNRFALNLGPEIAKQDFNMAEIADHDQHLKEVEFINLVDRIARKTLLNVDRNSDGSMKRFFLKGHFLYAAPALYKKYPDASFLTVIRDPLSRFQSGINYLRVNPPDPVLGPVPWNWLRESLVYTETRYCDVEQDWFTASINARRCVIQFSEYVENLESVMKEIYRSCFNSEELPPHIPRKHTPRKRTNYTVNKTLSELGINENDLRRRLTDYIEWCTEQDYPEN